MIDKSFPLSGPIALDCRLEAGSLTVHAVEDAQQARVVLTPRQGSPDLSELYQVELVGDTLSVRGEHNRGWGLLGRGEHDAADVVVELPAGSTARLRVGSAGVSTRGRLGDTDIACGSARVAVERVAGSLRIRGGSGSVEIGEVAAAAAVSLGSGTVQIGVAHGPVRVKSGSGGAVIGAAGGDVEVTSGSGEITVGLPPGQPARLDVLTGSGRLRTEMDVSDHAPAAGSAPITVRARTGSGDVIIRRSAA
jgi:hypothetical protein